MSEERERDAFLSHIELMCEYWREVDLKSSRGEMEDETKERLEGLAFSILVALDGGAGGLPGYEVKPLYDEYGEEYMNGAAPDIGGCLHELFGSDRNDTTD